MPYDNVGTPKAKHVYRGMMGEGAAAAAVVVAGGVTHNLEQFVVVRWADTVAVVIHSSPEQDQWVGRADSQYTISVGF